MEAIQEVFTDMTTVLKTAISTIDPAILASIQNFNPAHAAFLAKRTSMFTHIGQQGLDRSGNEINKSIKRANVTVTALDFGAKMISFAGATENNILLNEINFTQSELEKQTDLEFITSCSIISQKATEYLTELLPYGLTALMVTDFDNQREEFDVLKPLPITGRNQKKEATAEIKEDIKVLKSHLLVMDRAIRTVKLSQPELYKNYFNARNVTDPQTRIMSGKGTITDVAGEPMPFVKMTCKDLGISRRISPNGSFYIQTVPNGSYTFIFERAGYKTIKRIFAFYHGVRTEITIVMELND